MPGNLLNLGFAIIWPNWHVARGFYTPDNERGVPVIPA